MTTSTQQLDIRRIYSSSPARAATTVRTKATTRRRTRFSVLGPLSLLIAGAWVFVAWWPAFRVIGANLTLTALNHYSAISGEEVTLADLFGTAPDERANPAPPEGTEAYVGPVEQTPGPPAPVGPSPEEAEAIQAESERIMRSLYIDIGVWWAVTTLVAGWLAMGGGAAVAGNPVTDPSKRSPMVLVAIIAVLAAALIGSRLWSGLSVFGLPKLVGEAAFVLAVLVAAYLLAKCLSPRFAGTLAAILGIALAGVTAVACYDWYSDALGLVEVYPAFAPRIVPVALVFVAVLAGAALHRRAVGLHRSAVFAVLLAAVVTVAALKIASQLGGVHTHTLSLNTYAAVACLQAAYAPLLAILLALRLR